jgi:hypothetical protein
MFCATCGQEVVPGPKYCGRCGGAILNSQIATSRAMVTAAKRSTRRSVFAVAIIGGILVSCVGALFIYANRLTEEERQANEKATRLAHEKAAAAFTNMSSAQHLAAAQQAMRSNATIDQIEEAVRHLKAIPPSISVEGAKAKALGRDLTALRKKRQEELTRIKAMLRRGLRDQMAKNIENSMLDKGYNVDVSAIGDDHTVLHLKWVLVSKVMAHQLTKQAEFFENARAAGFRRIEITDGFRQTWYWDLH